MERILIVEDEFISRYLLINWLKEYDLADTTSCSEAKELLQNNTYDLVVTDLLLPGCTDKFELIRYVHDNYGIPIIVTTAYTDEKILNEIKEAGASACFVKPFTKEDILEIIRTIFLR